MKPETSAAMPRRRWPGILGRSFLCDPFGRVIAEASHDKEEILIGEVDLRVVEDVRRNWPFLRDRRIDSYGADHQQDDRLTGRTVCESGSEPCPSEAIGPVQGEQGSPSLCPCAVRSHAFNTYPMKPSPRDPLSHARRMGATRFHLAGLAALPRRLARQIRADPLGLRRNHPPPGPTRAHRPDRQQRSLGEARPQGPEQGERSK